LLSESENTSKNETPLKAWMESRKGETLVDPLIPPGTDLAFEAFPDFVAARSGRLHSMLDAHVGVAAAASGSALVVGGSNDS
jgi:hypothetical protein